MDIKDLKVLIKMVTETDITEFEMDNSDEKVVIRRGPKTEYVAVAAPAPQAYATPQQAPAAVAAPAAPVSAAETPAEAGETVNSPIVGTFYRAPAPDAAPYAEVGQVVEKGQILCIVEAMKLMNEIEAEYRCKIVKICKENAQPVEFGDALFVVEKL
ncbi:acetyl-CoA carboxylase biotin carboxyl carrier protein [Oryzomonas sagensis]|uniref:Biotin carboxyl carrier protein of acetyl-CoA carboxylase n=1 Tax=Oryzomonas sagensis TaxID=2603857 RepID=A0ABQ6TK12_9BACT|nr:acetyl-CoA carboxylase biotin carboxyl carrier protein [Oryzomonas sagensis]KAB0668186.1 acetyl-CoA carboxylase biotin carboxyl carrier protein [Oryzomonas sagensis]